MKKVLFISNYFEGEGKKVTSDGSYLYPLGVLAIATNLESHGHDVKVIDLNSDRVGQAEIFKTIEEFQPDLVGITTYTENLSKVFKLARRIKQMNPEMKVLSGGPHATLEPMRCIKNKYVDFVSVKEGENSILELLESMEEDACIELKDIKSLLYKKGKEIIVNEESPYLKNLDLYPLFKLDYIPESKGTLINIATSRGCPARCIYCSAAALAGSKYRVRQIENVYLETVLRFIDSDKKKLIYIVDDTFTAFRKRVSAFTHYLKEYGIKMKWACESRVDVMTEELIHSMAESGCVDIQYGIESGSQGVLDGIKKNINLEKARDVLQWTYEAGLILTLSFMIGHYCDTKETMKETRDFIKELYEKYPGMTNIAVSYNTPFPGTYQYDYRDELGMRLTDERYDMMTLGNPIVETNEFSVSDLRSVYFDVLQYTREGEKI